MASRKRRAPGASPSIPQQADIQSNPYSPAANTLSADQFTHNWSGPGMEGDMSALFTDPALYDYAGGLAATGGQPSHSRVISLDGLEEAPAVDADIVSGQLVRRNPNHQLAPRGRNAWDGFNNEKQGEWPSVGREDEELEQKALMARRDAQSKRKQIPPFVQKLSR
jgi:heat shock transcription factor